MSPFPSLPLHLQAISWLFWPSLWCVVWKTNHLEVRALLPWVLCSSLENWWLCQNFLCKRSLAPLPCGRETAIIVFWKQRMLDRAMTKQPTLLDLDSQCVSAGTAQQLMEPAGFSALLVEVANNPVHSTIIKWADTPLPPAQTHPHAALAAGYQSWTRFFSQVESRIVFLKGRRGMFQWRLGLGFSWFEMSAYLPVPPVGRITWHLPRWPSGPTTAWWSGCAPWIWQSTRPTCGAAECMGGWWWAFGLPSSVLWKITCLGITRSMFWHYLCCTRLFCLVRRFLPYGLKDMNALRGSSVI